MRPKAKLVLYLFACSAVTISMAIFGDGLLALDASAFGYVGVFSNPMLDTFFISMTYYGSVFFWLFMVVLFWLRGDRRLSLRLGCALVIGALSSFALKSVFQRPRPEEYVMNFFLSESDFGSSFPSGHAEKAFSGSVVLAHFYNHRRIFYSLSVLTAISRVYVGAHYPLDILFGSLLGLAVGEIALMLPTKNIEKFLLSASKRLKF